MRIKSIIVLATLALAILPVRFTHSVTAERKASTAYLYVEIETKVYRKGVEISSENPSERRWYFSNVVVQPEDVPSYSLASKRSCRTSAAT